MKRFRPVADGLFIGLIMAVLLAGLVKTAVFPDEINGLENRYADRIARPTLSSYLDGSFQDSVEAALSDQMPGARWAKRGYNLVSAGARKLLMSGVYSHNKGRYIRLSDTISVFGGDYLVYDTRVLENMKPALDKKAADINAFSAAHPRIPLYIYYIEKDTDIDFETDEKVGAYDYLAENLTLSEENMAVFRIGSFKEYSEKYYRTDHHWNWRGSYEGYRDVLQLLGGGEPLKPAEELTLAARLSGSKAIESGGKDVLSEDFTAYRFDWPPFSIFINGAPAGDYGAQEVYFAGGGDELSYGSFYGGDYGEVVFDSGNTEKDNLLVIGESHDNAIVKLLAGSFNRTYSVDLRYYSAYMGTDFDIDAYIANNDIDKVLLIGSIGFYISEDFNLT